MGNYNLKINVLRCENCYSIRRITIDPSVPHSFVNLECRCNTSRKNLQNFLSELRKGIQLKISCNNCKKEDKNSLYCNNCNHIYCSKCISTHKKHVYIPLSKLDYYCVFHQSDLYCAYCYDCAMNLCKKCIKDKKHQNHNCKEFKNLMTKNDRNYLKEKLGLAQSKLEFNTQFVNAFVKRVNKEENKVEIVNAERQNLIQNNDILELINFFITVYDNSKNKNFSIIHNLTENINLNVNKFKFIANNLTLESAYQQLLSYYTNDFIIVKNDGNWDEKKRDEIKRNKSIWEIDDDCVIESRQTVVGANAFNVIMSFTEFPKAQKSEEFKVNTNNNNNTNKKLVNENKIHNNGKKDNENKDDEKEEEILNRPRSHAFFVPASVCQKQVKENKHLHEEKSNINNDLNIDNVKKEEDKPETVKEENEEIKKEENIKETKEIEEEKKIEKNVKENQEVEKEKEIIKSKQETKIRELYPYKENKNKYFKYAKFVGINRYRNKTNSIVNKMMINSFKNSKII